MARSLANRLVDHELWPLGAGVALVTFTTRRAAWGLALIVLLWLARWLARGSPTERTPIDLPALVLAATVPLTLLATTDLAVTFGCVARLLAGLALAYGLANRRHRGSQIPLLALGLSAVGVGLALLALVSVDWFLDVKLSFLPEEIYNALPRMVTDTIHPNIMAGALVMLLPFLVAPAVLTSEGLPLWSAPKAPTALARVLGSKRLQTWALAAGSVLMLGVLLLTKSRGGWIAGLVVLFVVLVRRWPILLALVPVALLAVVLLGWSGQLPAVLDSVTAGGALSGWAGRVEMWSRAIHLIEQFPFTGIGAGTFRPVADALYPFYHLASDVEIPHAHNLLLQVAVDLGIPGLVAFLATLVAAVWSAVCSAQYYRERRQPALEAVAWAGLASLLGMAVHGFVDCPVWIIGRTAFVPWAVIGIVLALQKRPEMEALAEAPGPESTADRPRHRPLLRATLALLLAVSVVAVAAILLAATGEAVPSETVMRLPLLPGAVNTEVRLEEPAPDSGWAGLIEAAGCTTTQPITDVAAFYDSELRERGWETAMATCEDDGCAGIYTRDEGYSVCLLNVFYAGGTSRVSIVCGDREEPLGAPMISALPGPDGE
jgi:putative inorganic carbon (HCO3(-)) transporter